MFLDAPLMRANLALRRSGGNDNHPTFSAKLAASVGLCHTCQEQAGGGTTLAEKALYHQIHPLKLGTDITAFVVSLYVLRQHRLVLGLLLHFVPPVVATILVMNFVNLAPQKNSRFGRYVARMMTRPIEGLRLFGDIVSVFGAWYHSGLVIAAGLAIVLAAWLSGLVTSPRTPAL